MSKGWRRKGQGSFEVDDFDVRWAESWYAANADRFPNHDYSLVREDTRTQDRARRAQPFMRADHDEARAMLPCSSMSF